MKLFKPIVGLAIGLTISLSGFGRDPGPASADTPMTIVSSLPALGEAADEVVAMQNAIRMALADSPGRAGVTLRYEPLDDSSLGAGGWDSRAEARNARKAADNPSAIA